MNEHAHPAAAPHRPIAFAAPRVERTDGADGTIRVSCTAPLGAYDPSLARLFRSAVERQPDRVFLAERTGDIWRKLTYADARRTVDSLATSLLARGLSAERPVMVLSANSI